MQTRLADKTLQHSHGAEVETILRKCVHCGFCNATCPTYQLLGDELDGPRGRIYQMKQFFEGEPANTDILKHLDRCLTCRACETTCPSGVNYSHLLDIGRQAIEEELPRPWQDRVQRWAILRFITSGWFFAFSLKLAQALTPVLPARLSRSIPQQQHSLPRRQRRHERKVLMLAGCVQPALTPNTNIAALNLLDRFGIEVIEIPAQQCCGAAAMHTSDPGRGLMQARQLIDSCWSHVDNGVEAIVVTASGCGVSVKDYGRLLADDPIYAEKAARVSELYCDLVEIIEANSQQINTVDSSIKRVAMHTPCTMQHGLGINGRVEQLLQKAGYELCRVEEAHLCCGSAGTYSLLQAELSSRLQQNKLRALAVDRPDIIATANVGCQVHLAQDANTPVLHWIELL